MSQLSFLVPLINAHVSEFTRAGVLSVRPGYVTKNHWPTDHPAIIVTVSPGTDTKSLPTSVENTPVEIRKADPVEHLRFSDAATYHAVAQRHEEFRRDAFPAIDLSAGERKLSLHHTAEGALQAPALGASKTQIPYTPAPVPLKPVSGKIPLLCHASPDAGWPTLKSFLAGTQSTLTVAMYDFTSAHILQAVATDLAGKQSLKLVLDKPAKNPTADQTDTQTVSALGTALGSEFEQAWALVRSNNALPQFIFPSAYHIKVAVRDSASAWVSSGNWNNSNQPDMDPIGNPSDGDQALAAKSDRDWHVIIGSPEIARQFTAYIEHDLAIAESVEHPAAALSLQPPVEIPFTLRLAAQGTFLFHPPLQISGEQLTITPLLTPDTDSYRPHMLTLLQSAQSKLYVQLQYIHPPQDGVDTDFKALIDVVIAKIAAGVDVRIICSQWQATQGWLERLQEFGISLSTVRLQNGVHNKGFIVDGEKVAVGSQNWSGDGVLRNRDASVIIDSRTAAQYYEAVFLHDWDRLATQSMSPAPGHA